MLEQDFSDPRKKYHIEAGQKQTLEKPFRLKGTQDEQDLLTELVNRTAQSPFAKSVLEKAASLGYEICFEDLGNARGCCRSTFKQIILSRQFQPADWTATLVHECRHADQISRGATAGHTPYISMETQLKEKRLMEADACAASARACYELLEEGDYMPAVVLRRTKAGIFDAYQHAARDGESSDKAMTAAALAWYDDELYKMAYEIDHVMTPLSMGAAYRNPSGDFEEMPLAESVRKICNADGKTYFSEPYEKLNEPHYAGISEMTANWVKKHIKSCRDLGAEVDPSLEKIPVYKSTPFIEVRFHEKYDKTPDVLSDFARKELEEKRANGEKPFDRPPRLVPLRPKVVPLWMQYMKFER